MWWSEYTRCSLYPPYKKSDWWELKIALWKQRIVYDEISPTLVPESPNTCTKDTNKISDVLNDVKKDLMRHVNSDVENLKALIDNEFTTIRESI